MPCSSDLDAASSAVFLRCALAAGLLSEAFSALTAFVSNSASRRSRTLSEDTNSLVDIVAKYCERNKTMDELLAMPFVGELEKAITAWLSMRAGSLTGEHLPLYFLRRGDKFFKQHLKLFF